MTGTSTGGLDRLLVETFCQGEHTACRRDRQAAEPHRLTHQRDNPAVKRISMQAT